MNLNEEIIDGHLVTSDVKKLWSVEIDLAQKLLDFCSKHDLKIWAYGGTLLGAVRHKGFIPWDDDMDFSMMREDFNKLREIGPREFKYPYFLQTFYNDGIDSASIKLRRSDTAMITTYDPIHSSHNLGIAIDIFVDDAVPKSEKQLKSEYKKVCFLNRLVCANIAENKHSMSFKTRFLHNCVKLYFKIRNVESINERIDRILQKNKIEDCDEIASLNLSAVLGWGIDKIWRRRKEWYNDTIMLPFHDLALPAPKEYDKVLTALYGDYMKPVKGSSSHSMLVIDCDRSYKTVIEEILSSDR